jgi:hypothetical protein
MFTTNFQPLLRVSLLNMNLRYDIPRHFNNLIQSVAELYYIAAIIFLTYKREQC